MTDSTRPWLGIQEGLYQSNFWLLGISNKYQSKLRSATSLNDPGRVWPGKSPIQFFSNADAALKYLSTRPVLNESDPVIIVGDESWITDMERATSMRPKLHGFEYGRIQEKMAAATGEDRPDASVISPAERLSNLGHNVLPENEGGDGQTPEVDRNQGEYAMAYDLMVSCLAEMGEVVISYHMVDPFVHIEGESDKEKRKKFETLRRFRLDAIDILAGTILDESRSKDYSPDDFDALAQAALLLNHNFERMGKFLKDVLENPLVPSHAKIHVRLFHEANDDFFWWSRPKEPHDSSLYYSNYRKLWLFARDRIRAEINPPSEDGSGSSDSAGSAAGTDSSDGTSSTDGTGSTGDAEERIVWVLSMNREPPKNANHSLQDALNEVFGNQIADSVMQASDTEDSEVVDDIIDFRKTIGVLGLDYYQELNENDGNGELETQYAVMEAKIASLALGGYAMEHALTEVGVRTFNEGHLYARRRKRNKNEDGTDGALISFRPRGRKRRFFTQVLSNFVKRDAKPKWVMFWVNRTSDDMKYIGMGLNNFEQPPSSDTQSNDASDDTQSNDTSDDTQSNDTRVPDYPSEFFYPVVPMEPFYVRTFKEAEPENVRISASQDKFLTRLGGNPGDPTFMREYGRPYRLASMDFWSLVSSDRRAKLKELVTGIDAGEFSLEDFENLHNVADDFETL